MLKCPLTNYMYFFQSNYVAIALLHVLITKTKSYILAITFGGDVNVAIYQIAISKLIPVDESRRHTFTFAFRIPMFIIYIALLGNNAKL